MRLWLQFVLLLVARHFARGRSVMPAPANDDDAQGLLQIPDHKLKKHRKYHCLHSPSGGGFHLTYRCLECSNLHNSSKFRLYCDSCCPFVFTDPNTTHKLLSQKWDCQWRIQKARFPTCERLKKKENCENPLFTVSRLWNHSFKTVMVQRQCVSGFKFKFSVIMHRHLAWHFLHSALPFKQASMTKTANAHQERKTKRIQAGFGQVLGIWKSHEFLC